MLRNRHRQSGLLFALLLLGIHSRLFSQSQPFWWEIELQINLSGSYTYRDGSDLNSRRYTGDFSVKKSACAILERDNGDYVLLKVENNRNGSGSVMWKESVTRENRHELRELAQRIRPHLGLDYALRENGLLKVAITLESAFLPLQEENIDTTALFVWPLSYTGSLEKNRRRYFRKVFRGSNKIYIRDRLLYKKPYIMQDFAWKWRSLSPGWQCDQNVKVRVVIKRRCAKQPAVLQNTG